MIREQSSPSVSIIVPCKDIDDYTRECISHCRRLDYGSYETILLPDRLSSEIEGAKAFATGDVTPGRKRNIGIEKSKGELCAFVDSDAYPRGDWLRNAVTYFDDPSLAGVGGPGLTPEHDSLLQQASGHVLSSFAVAGLSKRYKAGRAFESNDIHSCNFMARRSVLQEVGGWNEKYWPGEDTLLCLAITTLGKKLIEAPDIVVFHHRRSLFGPHLEQIWRFGLHRGFFARKFPGNSLRLTYLAPSVLVAYLLVAVVLAISNSFFWVILVGSLAIYALLCLVTALAEVRGLKLFELVWIGIMATHLVYGLAFLSGLIHRDLQR